MFQAEETASAKAWEERAHIVRALRVSRVEVEPWAIMYHTGWGWHSVLGAFPSEIEPGPMLSLPSTHSLCLNKETRPEPLPGCWGRGEGDWERSLHSRRAWRNNPAGGVVYKGISIRARRTKALTPSSCSIFLTTPQEDICLSSTLQMSKLRH